MGGWGQAKRQGLHLEAAGRPEPVGGVFFPDMRRSNLIALLQGLLELNVRVDGQGPELLRRGAIRHDIVSLVLPGAGLDGGIVGCIGIAALGSAPGAPGLLPAGRGTSGRQWCTARGGTRAPDGVPQHLVDGLKSSGASSVGFRRALRSLGSPYGFNAGSCREEG